MNNEIHSPKKYVLKNTILLITIAFGSWFLFSGWGLTGHKKISTGAAQSFDPLLTQFHEWTAVISEHSGDADKRKSWDKNEGIKHYIDLDNYSEFNETGLVSQIYDTLVSRYGEAFVKEQGTLPWATLASFDSLVATLKRNDFDQAVLFAADLSHYSADGHMPLHLTRNYDGQFSDNKGIHSRYESNMINRYAPQLDIQNGDIQLIDNVSDYIFEYLYACYPYLDTILQADDYAKSVDANTSSTAYVSALWEKTESVSNFLFSKASLSFASLLYTAWEQAGQPNLTEHTFVADLTANRFLVESVYVNNTDSMVTVLLQVDEALMLNIEMVNMNGNAIYSEKTKTIEKGSHEFSMSISGLPNGIYILTFSGNGRKATEKFVVG